MTLKIVIIEAAVIVVLILVGIILFRTIRTKNQRIKKLEGDLKGLQENLASVEGLYNKIQAAHQEKEELHEEVHNSTSLSDSADKLRDDKPKRNSKS